MSLSCLIVTRCFHLQSREFFTKRSLPLTHSWIQQQSRLGNDLPVPQEQASTWWRTHQSQSWPCWCSVARSWWCYRSCIKAQQRHQRFLKSSCLVEGWQCLGFVSQACSCLRWLSRLCFDCYLHLFIDLCSDAFAVQRCWWDKLRQVVPLLAWRNRWVHCDPKVATLSHFKLQTQQVKSASKNLDTQV